MSGEEYASIVRNIMLGNIVKIFMSMIFAMHFGKWWLVFLALLFWTNMPDVGPEEYGFINDDMEIK